jgi:hypothetical protein
MSDTLELPTQDIRWRDVGKTDSVSFGVLQPTAEVFYKFFGSSASSADEAYFRETVCAIKTASSSR